MNVLRIAQTCAFLIAAVASSAATETSSSASDFSPGSSARIRTTAYTATEPNGGGYKSAIGTKLNHSGPMYSAAADWSWMPLGTVFRMKDTGRTYKVEDYGSALVGRQTVDIYMPNDAKMNAWGVRQVDIEIIEMGCFKKSLSVLEPRTKSPHVRKMVNSLRQRAALNGSLLAAANTSGQVRQ